MYFFFKQKTAYEMRISDWSSDVCSSDLALLRARGEGDVRDLLAQVRVPTLVLHGSRDQIAPLSQGCALAAGIPGATFVQLETENHVLLEDRSEEHTSELQSLMRISYAVFCLKKKKKKQT